MNLERIKLNTTVFVCGFVVMAFEIIGSRVLAPYLGTSTFVWVSIIGIILMAMSAGYYTGGRLADKQARLSQLSSFILLAAIGICLMNLAKNQLLSMLATWQIPLIIKTIIASSVLFSIPAFFLAAVFPYALRLVLTDIENSGQQAGKFYAISTLGSIGGTFLSATLFLPLAGTTNILWMLASALLIIALWISMGKTKIQTSILLILLGANIWYVNRDNDRLDIDSEYNRITIYDALAMGEPTRYMALNGHVNSGIWVNDPIERQLYQYSDYFRLAMHFNPNFKHTLMLGAGAYTFPKLYQHLWPDAQLDIVELDPILKDLSEMHFFWNKNENTKIFHEDARTFINHADNRYDIIISDVFTSPLEVPFQMTTLETYQKQYEMLNPGGVLILNVLGNASGPHSNFLKSQVKLAQTVFPQSLLFMVDDGYEMPIRNNMLVAFKHENDISLTSSDEAIQKMLNNRKQVEISTDVISLTDDYAPANWLLWN